ncbi:hypothetical protein C8J57DRAFT_1223142 [Mycena rebaudengoi]|nr:hypothetical protein C8J57DRAFT_1223142 [Mycena rebaudengoi]
MSPIAERKRLLFSPSSFIRFRGDWLVEKDWEEEDHGGEKKGSESASFARSSRVRGGAHPLRRAWGTPTRRSARARARTDHGASISGDSGHLLLSPPPYAVAKSPRSRDGYPRATPATAVRGFPMGNKIGTREQGRRGRVWMARKARAGKRQDVRAPKRKDVHPVSRRQDARPSTSGMAADNCTSATIRKIREGYLGPCALESVFRIDPLKSVCSPVHGRRAHPPARPARASPQLRAPLSSLLMGVRSADTPSTIAGTVGGQHMEELRYGRGGAGERGRRRSEVPPDGSSSAAWGWRLVPGRGVE